MKTLPDLGAEFQALRKESGLSQKETAQRVGMRQEALSRFERGRGGDFSVAKLLRLAQALGRDLDFALVQKRPPTLDDLLADRRAQSENSRVSEPGPMGYSGVREQSHGQAPVRTVKGGVRRSRRQR